jgi:hypothetical protein
MKKHGDGRMCALGVNPSIFDVYRIRPSIQFDELCAIGLCRSIVHEGLKDLRAVELTKQAYQSAHADQEKNAPYKRTLKNDFFL